MEPAGDAHAYAAEGQHESATAEDQAEVGSPARQPAGHAQQPGLLSRLVSNRVPRDPSNLHMFVSLFVPFCAPGNFYSSTLMIDEGLMRLQTIGHVAVYSVLASRLH